MILYNRLSNFNLNNLYKNRAELISHIYLLERHAARNRLFITGDVYICVSLRIKIKTAVIFNTPLLIYHSSFYQLELGSKFIL